MAKKKKQLGGYVYPVNYVPKAQRGTASSDNTSVRKSAPMLTMAEYQKQQEEANKQRLAQKAAQQAASNAATMQSPSSLPKMSRQQVYDLNKQYAQQSGRLFNSKTGAVEPVVSDNAGRMMDRAMENIVEPMLDIEMVMSGAPLLGQGLKATGKFLTEQTALKNAYKINPWAFKANPASSYNIGSRLGNLLNTTINPLGILSDYGYGFLKGGAEQSAGLLRELGILKGNAPRRPFFETFPITKAQKAKVSAMQDEAFDDARKFTQQYWYGNNTTMRPVLEEKIREILPNIKLAKNIDNLEFFNSPFSQTKEQLIPSTTWGKGREGLSDEIIKYLNTNRGRLGGVNDGEVSLTLRNRGLYYLPPKDIANIVAHEAGHTAQKFGYFGEPPTKSGLYDLFSLDKVKWSEQIDKHDPKYNYFTSNPDTELGQRFQKALVEPKNNKLDNNFTIQTWRSSPNELHSELMASKYNLYKKGISEGFTPEEMIEKVTNPGDKELEWLLKNKSINKHFKKGTPLREKLDLLKILPATVPAIAGAASAVDQKKNGGWLDEFDVPEAQVGEKIKDYVKKPVKAIEKKLLDEYVYPAVKESFKTAKAQGLSGEHNGPLDAIRHATSASTVSSILPSWMNFIPQVGIANFVGSNLLGAAHEITSPNPIREIKSDVYNNIIGSGIGMLPLSDSQKRKLIIDAQKKGILSTLESKQDGGGVESTMDGLTDKGFDYNGAWGGPSMQNGGLTFLEPTSKKLPRGHVIPYNTPSTELAMSIGGEDGEPAYLIPSFKYGKPLEDPVAEFNKTGEHLGGPFKTWQEADEWERTVRHPYVEKGQNIPTPLRRWGKDYQMGGSIPGSVGFTYARTEDPAPSKGKYAKKTMASAQDGEKIEYKELPEIVVVGGKDKDTVNYYRNELDKLYISKDGSPTWKGADDYGKYYAKMQIAKQFGVPKIRPQEPIGHIGSFFRNRSGIKSDPNEPWSQYDPITKTVYTDFNEYENQYIPELSHYVSQKEGTLGHVKRGAYDLMQYALGNDPYDTKGGEEYHAHKEVEPKLIDRYYDLRQEGEKKYKEDAYNSWKRAFYERTGKLQNGGEMKFYQEGLDWTPKNISRDGSEIKKDDMGYWNPENWGKPVEIGSNEITMQGVDQPLLGISDTGDVQMMYPGEDYTFDGESVTEYPVAQKGKKVKVSMSDFKKMGNSYKDSVNTYDYNQALWDAVRSRKSSEVDKAISQNKNLITNTSNIKPTSYDNVTVGGKNYRIPNYQYPQMDPWETYEPVEGWWERVQSNLGKASDVVNRTSIGKQIGKVSGKIDDAVQNIWHKFTSDDESDNVTNKGAEVLTNKQPVSKPVAKPVAKKETPDQFGLTRQDYIEARKGKFTSTPGNNKGDGYYEFKKNGKPYKLYTVSGGNSWVDVPTASKPKPVQPVVYKKPEPKKEQPVKKQEQPKPVERKQNVYEGSPVYSGSIGSGMPSALIGFANQRGDTTYIKPEDYERFGVPKYGKEYIESKTTNKKKNGGWLDEFE